jgi:predicted metal-dependent TIM-barrel fold hydrolase
MVSRVTDDYQAMVVAGCAAVCEPAFWAGFDRSSADGFYDYFCQLTEHEPKRAAKFGLPHFSWLCINPKESEDVKLASDVTELVSGGTCARMVTVLNPSSAADALME